MREELGYGDDEIVKKLGKVEYGKWEKKRK